MYSILILWTLVFLLIFILLKLLNINKNYFVSFLITLFIIIFVINLKISIDSALLGVNLALKTIVPTIFPFSVICNLLISYDGISLYSKILGPLICRPLKLSKNSSFPIVASIISGYPLGCKYCCDLYSLGYINKNQFQRLLNIASNCSPMFIVGSIGVTMFGNPNLGFILLIANYISPIIVGILTMKKDEKFNNLNSFPSPNSSINKINFGSALKSALENGINTTLQVGAFVVLFSIIIGIIKNNANISIAFSNLENLLHLPSMSIYGIFLGSIEFTNGCKLLSSTTLSMNLKLSIVSFICSFSGFSVIAQITSFIGKYDVSIKKYVFWKLIQGIISFIITFISCNIFLNSTTVSTLPSNSTFINYKLLFLLLSLTILLLPIICKLIIKRLR